MTKIYINPGHSDKDPGAVGYETERKLNVSVSQYMNDYLLANYECETKMTPGTMDSLTAICNDANSWGADLFVSNHFNAGGGDGCEIFHHYKGGASKTLAQNVLNAIVALGQNSRGLKTKRNALGKDYYQFIRETKCPAIIVECAFLDSKDVHIIDTDAEQKAMGKAIAKGVLKELGIAYVEEKPAVKEDGKIYRVQVGAYRKRENAEAMQKRLKSAGFDAIIV